jgi:Tfp pilus assembly protein PilO
VNARKQQHATSVDPRRQWAYGLGLLTAGILLAVLPAAARLRRGMRDLRRARATYALKVSWAGNKDELRRRVAEQAAAVAALDARLLASPELPELTRAINAAAQAAACSVRSIRPSEPLPLPRPVPKRKGQEPAAEWVQWRLWIEVQGEYAQVSGLLERLDADSRHLCIRRLVLQPAGEDRETLVCELELAAFGLRSGDGRG